MGRKKYSGLSLKTAVTLEKAWILVIVELYASKDMLKALLPVLRICLFGDRGFTAGIKLKRGHYSGP